MSSSLQDSRREETILLLDAARSGDDRAADTLFAQVYQELRRLAQRQISDDALATLSATELVHEAYLKLLDSEDWSSRAHFMAVASRAMRQIVVDRARARNAQKRGGKLRPITLNDDIMKGVDMNDQIVAISDALEELEARNKDLARLVEMRFFGGLEVKEIAEVLGVSERTAARQWARAKAHMHSFLS